MIIGGTALALLGVVNRPTRDCDVLCPPIEPEIARLAESFAKHRRQAGDPLADDWWNNGPASLISVLPVGWQERLVVVHDGRALLLRTLGRGELLCARSSLLYVTAVRTLATVVHFLQPLSSSMQRCHGSRCRI